MVRKIEMLPEDETDARSAELDLRVARAVQAALKPVMEALAETKGQPVAGDTNSILSGLALAIAEINDQDSGRPKRLSPAEMARRAHARAQMEESIAEERRKAAEYKKRTKQDKDPGPDAPHYLAVGKLFLAEQVIQPFEVDSATKKPHGVSFRWLGAPNEAMRPINDAAKRIYDLFIESIGGPGKSVVSATQPWISAGGLVIDGIGGIPTHRAAPDPLELAGDLTLGPGQYDPRRDNINVLGTVAPPARHTGSPDRAA